MKKKIFKIAVGIVIFLALILFIVANIKMLGGNYRDAELAKNSCNGLSEGDSCEVFYKKGIFDGVCEETVRDELVCKVNMKPWKKIKD